MKRTAGVRKKVVEEVTGEIKGIIFNIQRFSLHDGPGIRTVIFFKGCPLKCKWCCNPESIELSPQLIFNPDRCLKDGRCIEVCPSGARSEKGYSIERCTLCGKCVDACPSGALELVGRWFSIEEVIEEVEKDRLFYESSGGGVTLSGGEPVYQKEFATSLLRRLKMLSIHTAVETSGYAPWPAIEEIIDATDLLLYDLKHMDSDMHRKFTGVPNELIFENALKASFKINSMGESNKQMIFRVPLIGGVNTDKKNIEAVAAFALKAKVGEVHLLPYHRLGESKYRKLGKEYSFQAFTPDDELIEEIRDILQSNNLVVKVGG
ncbi:MAG: glycyl-radical enzyme activating protein [Spirochaetota bacterium]